MSSKLIVVLYGSEELKRRVNTLARNVKENNEAKYWTWNISYSKHVQSMLSTLNIDRNNSEECEKYELIYRGLLTSLNKYFDFSHKYLVEKITAFENDQNANVLFIHDCTPKFAKELVTEDNNVWKIQVGEFVCSERGHEPDFVIIDNENFDSEVLRYLTILTKDFNKENN